MMGHIHTKVDYQKVAQYLISIIHFTKKVEEELDKGAAHDFSKEICYNDDCSNRVSDRNESTL